MKQLVIILTMLAGLTRCNVPVYMQEKELEGIWRTDSINNFVNGFSFTNNTFDEHWSTFEYQPDGILLERRKEKFRKYRYRLPASDSLVYADSSGQQLSSFLILKLTDKQLVLKKAQKPYLPGKNQELFEVRFFTKMADGK
ncbi:hypothetical protein [Dyadobacter sediminis]|uniref:Lipocalin-like domain-containing protein n=1 Tax=Dyadobacter sediminis TaxID=1493691 RepID=A0A5R9KBX0_9BACT|nr:hypothetical protein [Dyadobacter sediminis]TLU92333.1 hypothetical protein FEM55_16540 [Dyadobacter sediminis]